MVKKTRYAVTFYATDGAGNRFEQYSAGKDYDVDDNSARHIALGIAEEVEVDDPIPPVDPEVAAGPAAEEPAAEEVEVDDPAAPGKRRGHRQVGR